MDTLTMYIVGDDLSFGTLIPFAGNKYIIDLRGEKDESIPHEIYVTDDSGERILAKSERDEQGVMTISFKSVSLRNEFEKNPHENRSFHVYVRSEGNTLSHGDMFIAWNPLWSDGDTGPAYTSKGEPGQDGKPGAKGDRGMSAYEVAVENGFKGTEVDWLNSLVGPVNPMLSIQGRDGKWHKLSVEDNGDGSAKTLAVEDEGTDQPVVSDQYVTVGTDQTVKGAKRFEKPVRCDVTTPPDEVSGWFACVPWVVKKVGSLISAITEFAARITFRGGVDIIGKATVSASPSENKDIANKIYVDTADGKITKSVEQIQGILRWGTYLETVVPKNASATNWVTIPDIQPGYVYNIFVVWMSDNSTFSVTSDVFVSGNRAILNGPVTIKGDGLRVIKHRVDSGMITSPTQVLNVSVKVSTTSIDSVIILAMRVA